VPGVRSKNPPIGLQGALGWGILKEYKKMNKKVFCVGLAVCDVPLRPVGREIFDRDHVRIETPVWATGGDASNVAVALARLGLDSCLCCLVGNDMYGDFILKRLGEAGVNTRNVLRHPDKGTGVSHILIEPGGERHFLVFSSINGDLSYGHINEELLAGSDLVYLGSAMHLKGMDEGGTAKLFKKAHELGKLTVSDFCGEDEDRGDYWLKHLEPMLRETDVALPSYREAVTLTGQKDLSGIRGALAPLGLKILVVKLGNQGCYITDFKHEWRIPIFPQFEVLDTTGAGDSFGAGFVRGLLAGWELEACGLFASAVAGFNVTKLGATGGVPDFETAWRFVTEHSGGASRFPLPVPTDPSACCPAPAWPCPPRPGAPPVRGVPPGD
jgi:sugar/nucleoside kinase (ribokinase family)